MAEGRPQEGILGLEAHKYLGFYPEVPTSHPLTEMPPLTPSFLQGGCPLHPLAPSPVSHGTEPHSYLSPDTFPGSFVVWVEGGCTCWVHPTPRQAPTCPQACSPAQLDTRSSRTAPLGQKEEDMRWGGDASWGKDQSVRGGTSWGVGRVLGGARHRDGSVLRGSTSWESATCWRAPVAGREAHPRGRRAQPRGRHLLGAGSLRPLPGLGSVPGRPQRGRICTARRRWTVRHSWTARDSWPAMGTRALRRPYFFPLLLLLLLCGKGALSPAPGRPDLLGGRGILAAFGILPLHLAAPPPQHRPGPARRAGLWRRGPQDAPADGDGPGLEGRRRVSCRLCFGSVLGQSPLLPAVMSPASLFWGWGLAGVSISLLPVR